MTVVFGTLGFRPKSLVPTLRSTPDVEKLVFYCGADESDAGAAEKVREARAAVLEYCRSMKIAADAVDLEDPFDFREIVKRIRGDIRKHKKEGKEISVFNIAGGTKPTSSAALVACILEGIPTVYIHDITYEEVHLPLLRMEYNLILSHEEREILLFLLRNADQQSSEVEIARQLGKHKATMNHHLKNLVRKGAVRLEKDTNDARKKVVKVEESAALLMGDGL